MKRIVLLSFILLIAAGMNSPANGAASQERPAKTDKAQAKSKALEEKPPSVTRHSIKMQGRELPYTATAGYMPLKNESGELEANIFFVAYTRDQENSFQRPVMFAYNGGPGASSTWLHLGALGPQRIVLTEEGKAPPPPYRLAPNEYTWLVFTDLVFIDPVGTGYSRPAPGVDAKKYFGVEEDIRSIGEFIRLYVTKYQRWLSPKFVAGESYGTTRTAGLTGYLQNKLGMNLNGVILISSVLNFQTIVFTPGNNLPYVLYLPAYTVAAWYHRKLPPQLQADLPRTREDVEKFAMHEYLLALAQGNRLPEEQRTRIVDRLAAYTGLSEIFIRNSDLKISADDFRKELLRNERRRVGILDSRITGTYQIEDFMEDPSVFEVVGPMAATWNDYVKRELRYENDLPYILLSTKANRLWDWSSNTGGLGYVNVATTLQQAMSENKYLKVFIASGFYDLDTSYFAAKYTVNHLDLDPTLQGNITMAFYEGGHQMYTDLPSLKRLTADVSAFVGKSLPLSH